MERGEVWLIDLSPTIGAEMQKVRPAVIVNDDPVGILPLRIIVPITEGALRSSSLDGSAGELTREWIEESFRGGCLSGPIPL